MAKMIINRAKGESSLQYNERAHRMHRANWRIQKENDVKWLSKKAYERKTGRPGQK